VLYCGTLWWTPRERELLKVKLAEGGPVDRWIIAEATHTFRGNRRELRAPEIDASVADRVTCVVADNSKVRGTHVPACRTRNAIQRDATLRGVSLREDDVFVFCDLDEIIHRGDWEAIATAARRYGYVLAAMRNYYGKLNLMSPKLWDTVFAVSGQFLRDRRPRTVDKLRRQRHESTGPPTIPIRGQHFGWLRPGKDTTLWDMKARNNSRQMAQPTTRKRLEAGRSPSGATLIRVDVDHTYPQAILDNMTYWTNFVEPA